MIDTIKHITGHRVEKIGTFSAFSKVYRSLDDSTVVFVVTTDPTKAIVSAVNNPHVPMMVNRGTIDGMILYETRYSRSVEIEDTNAKTIIMNLSAKWRMMKSTNENRKKSQRIDCKTLAMQFVASISTVKLYPTALIDGLTQLLHNAVETCDMISFDLPIENFGIDPDNGTLILRDVLIAR